MHTVGPQVRFHEAPFLIPTLLEDEAAVIVQVRGQRRGEGPGLWPEWPEARLGEVLVNWLRHRLSNPLTWAFPDVNWPAQRCGSSLSLQQERPVSGIGGREIRPTICRGTTPHIQLQRSPSMML